VANHNDVNKATPYNAQNFPNLGNNERFIAKELASIDASIRSLIAVMKLLEARMNTNGLS
jgi:hypothetical protein